MLVLAMSSAKPESLNTTRVSTAGASSLDHATIPALNGSITSFVRSSARHDDQRAAADGMDGLARDCLRLDRHAEIEPEFEQQLIENILLLAALNEVLGILQQAVFEIGRIRLPGSDVRGRKLEDPETSVSQQTEDWPPLSLPPRAEVALSSTPQLYGVDRVYRTILQPPFAQQQFHRDAPAIEQE